MGQSPSPSRLGVKSGRICLPAPPTRLDRDYQRPAGLTLLRPPTAQAVYRWCGNINPLPIGYAFRPRLRGRLTLGGRTFPRKPWAFGDTNSHRVYRYSCRHSHFHELHRPSRVLLQRWWNAPLPTSLMQSIRVIPRFR